ncbi:elongation factor P--(R)-beta-lysine ligase [Coxiella endosymbiont of Amblyomma nuttalli]|uniref:elongation factor P--(R)-beta-lysine ligase n=1 Tax=Coxiella endosymbiont of Amblyomma nuttalli TaxID=2749996 RepID=UPI00350FDAA7
MWQPTATLGNQKLRAKLYNKIRQFFAKRNVLEVETPLLSQYTVTDAHLHSFQTTYYSNNEKYHHRYLQTSPEYAMKRLLAAGSGPIYQICKAFRDDEISHQHNPEFTLLEWYRPSFNYHDLMCEMDALLQTTIQSKKAVRKTYEQLFLNNLSINPFALSLPELHTLSQKFSLQNASSYKNRDTLLQFLFAHVIEPTLGFSQPLFVYDFPASQSVSAKIDPYNPNVALRFEVYIKGLECANGFEELINASEQRRRFELENLKRKDIGLPEIAIDQRLLAALESGLPPCSGVALGLDRLLMIMGKRRRIDDVIGFTIDRA